MANGLTPAQQEIVDSYMKKFEQDFTIVANEVNELYFKQANKMFDSFIRQYYKYKTKSYIRHWEPKPGTGRGSNLYYAKDFKIHNRGKKNPWFELNISTERMADDYQRDSAAQVIQNVMNGIRGVPPYWFVPWSGEFSSRYFAYKGEPAQAFRTFIEHYEEMMRPIFMRRFKKLGWE